ncbi:acyltransferase family protein [Sphingomonas sp.]|uniref:acyltransferase family protein n=1 Tax=Sphingomonas sp. TaxID=28214 RepID=UPI0035C8517C
MEDWDRAARAPARAAAHPAYRPEIDGLRALAVVPVVLGHAGVRGFGGGFIGVDIFFVISGFLITGILVRDLRAGRYSIAGFYRRRILRIFPALFALLAAVTVVAVVAMLPTELVRFARSLGATALFWSNMQFYSESGYFDAASTTKPLLHTWSLAVEEQFYIFWPLLLAAVGAARLRRLGLVVALVSAVSLAASAVLIFYDISATFYSLPTRTWELGLGAILAIAGSRYRRRWAAEIGTAIGLVLILACVWRYHEFMLFPGPAALVPCLGACLLVLPGTAMSTVGRVFALAPVAFVGRISYSLYLWHWPVIVFTDTALLTSNDDPLIKAAEVAVSFLLAAVSWRFVEQPFRTGAAAWPTRSVLLGAAGAVAIAVSVSGGLLALHGLPWRYSPQEQAIGAYLDLDVERAYRRGTCFVVSQNARIAPDCYVTRTRKPVVLLLGDSHAAHLWPGFAANRTDFEVLQLTVAGCRPLVHPSPSTICRQTFNRILLDWAPRHRPAAVLLSANWRADDLEYLRRTLTLPPVRALNPIVIGPIPQYDVALPRLLALSANRQDPELVRRSQRDAPFAMDARLRALTVRSRVSYVSLVDALCHGRTCRTLAAPLIPMQFDYGHLTTEGSRTVVRGILPQIEDILGTDGSKAGGPGTERERSPAIERS